MESLATNHAWEMESSPDNTWMSFLMHHQSITPEISITDTVCPNIAILNAQNVTCLKDALCHPWGVAPSYYKNTSPLTSWHTDDAHGHNSSVNSVAIGDFEAIFDIEPRDHASADIPNDVEIRQVSATTGSSRETNDFSHFLPLTPRTSPPQFFQCHRPSTGKQSEETVCGRCFPDRRGLTRHEQNVHTSDGYKCKCSTRLISRKDNHRRHVKRCNRTADPRQPLYICRCGMSDSDKDGHLHHLKTCTNRSAGAGRQPEIRDAT